METGFKLHMLIKNSDCSNEAYTIHAENHKKHITKNYKCISTATYP